MLGVGLGDSWTVTRHPELPLKNPFARFLWRMVRWLQKNPGALLNFEGVWTLEKWSTIEEEVPSAILRANPTRYGKPELACFGPNKIVNAGLNDALKLLVGASATAFNNANGYLGVGDSSTAEAAGQTDLQASSNKVRVAMNASYPTAPASQQTTFQSDFGASTGNFAWNEAAIFNASSSGTMLARKVISAGTKSSGTWTLSAVLTAASAS